MIRLKEVVYSLEDIKRKVLNLGYCGDKGVLEIKFDCSEFFNDKETKNAKLLLIKPDDTNSAIDLTITDDMASLSVDDGITDVVGFGEYQLKLDDGTNVFHSAKGRYHVGAVINDPTPVGLIGRTFMFNETIDFDFGEICTQMTIMNCIDPSDIQAGFNVLFTEQSTGEESVYGLNCIKQQGQVGVFYLFDPDAQQTLVYTSESGWSNQDLRTIRFVSDANVPIGLFPPDLHVLTTEEVLAWLSENATEITE